jgi:hypothetical protein
MTGNLTAFLTNQIALAGGRLPSLTNAIPPMESNWRFRSDTNGAQVFIDAKAFPNINEFFNNAIGVPDISTENEPGLPFVGYNITRAGVVIQYSVEPSPFPDVPNPMLHIIILKQQKLF